MEFIFQANRYPEQPGCYLMKNGSGNIIYIGKAKHLRNRLRSYFYSQSRNTRIQLLLEELADIEVILVNTEQESLLLENNLIKIHKPKYNRALVKDNSGYAYLMMTDEPVPRLQPYYRNRSDSSDNGAAEWEENSQVFGPYVNARFRHSLMDLISEHFQLRTCERLPSKVCLSYHMHKCSGVCEGRISREDYMETVQEASSWLSKPIPELLSLLRGKMHQFADNLEFEKALKYRGEIMALERLRGRQVVERSDRINQMIIYFGPEHSMILKSKRGILYRCEWMPTEPGLTIEEVYERLLEVPGLPEEADEWIVNRLPGNSGSWTRLKSKYGRLPKLTSPKKGDKLRLLELCKLNYDYRLEVLATR